MAYLMVNPKSSWKIRFLGHVLQGREVWLNEGNLSLGEKGCDICIPLTINEKIILREQADNLFVDAGKARVRVNGRRFNPNKPLPSSGVLQVAGWLSRLVNRIVNLLIIKYPFPDQATGGWLAYS